jgi:hypothetical protein
MWQVGRSYTDRRRWRTGPVYPPVVVTARLLGSGPAGPPGVVPVVTQLGGVGVQHDPRPQPGNLVESAPRRGVFNQLCGRSFDVAVCFGCELGAVGEAEFGEDVGEMALDGGGAYQELRTDLCVGRLDQRTHPRSTHQIRMRSCLTPLARFRSRFALLHARGYEVPSDWDKRMDPVR